MPTVAVLFLIIFLEGYIVLSVELLAIRQMIPFTGSGTDTVSIIIAAVLMPLAFGYYTGGRFRPKRTKKTMLTVRKKLLKNIAISCVFLTLGLSYGTIRIYTDVMHYSYSQHGRILITILYAALFIVTPVYLLGQTVPLISNYFSSERLSKTAGKILFFSTLGSFMGAVFCTLVLMTYLGVHNTVSITIACLLALSVILAKMHPHKGTIVCVICLAFSLMINSKLYMSTFGVVQNNAYSLVQIQDVPIQQMRVMRINHNPSSGIKTDDNSSTAGYINYIEEQFLDPVKDKSVPVKSILVLGAGGLTLGHGDVKNRYVFVDIDPDLKETAEKYFLKEKLLPNKEFIAAPARAYLTGTKEKFDLVIVDVFRGASAAPDHLVTREFFEQVRAVTNDNGIVVMNLLATADFSDPYSTRLDNTARSVFPHLNRHIVHKYDAWAKSDGWTNAVYSAWVKPEPDMKVYTDNKNSVMFDKKTMLQTYDRWR